ncbi:MAG: hypothetical protein AAF799_14525 [Myxococcota bacterium]
MAKFNVCARRILVGTAVASSYDWIDFHRCVEGLARLTGEPFTAVFARLEKQHGFGRRPGSWPDGSTLRAATRQLVEEREAWLARYRAFVEQRRREKKQGLRHRRREPLEELEASRRQHAAFRPRLGYWGWARLREGLGTVVPHQDSRLRFPIVRGGGLRVCLDLRRHPEPALDRSAFEGLEGALGRTELRSRVLVVVATAKIAAAWLENPGGPELRRALKLGRRLGGFRREIWLAHRTPAHAAERWPAVSDELRAIIDGEGWTLRAIRL